MAGLSSSVAGSAVIAPVLEWYDNRNESLHSTFLHQLQRGDGRMTDISDRKNERDATEERAKPISEENKELREERSGDGGEAKNDNRKKGA